MIPTARGRRALTLIELLTVVSVITILTALMSSILIRLPQEATRAKCAANLGEIAEALQLIKNDTHKLPKCFDVDAAGAVDENSWWFRAVVRKSDYHTPTHDQLSVPRDQDPWWRTPASRGFHPFRPETCIVRCPASTDHYDDDYSPDTVPKATSVDKDRVYDLNYGYTCAINYPFGGRWAFRLGRFAAGPNQHPPVNGGTEGG